MTSRNGEELKTVSARTQTEIESAFKVARLLQHEFGLSPCDADAELRGGSLMVCLRHALTPIGRLIARTEGGGRIVQGAYEVMHESCRERLHAQVARIVGLPVRRSRIEVDAAAEDVFVRFDLDLSLSLETKRKTQNA